MVNRIIKYFLENKVVTVLLLLALIGWGLVSAPFNWNIPFLPTNPVAVDAIPDIGENQQIVATEWMGRSPKDIEDQISFPLSTSLLGLPGVKTIRSTSMFGMSFIYIIFDDDIDFYWSRSRILEKLNSLPSGTLPEGVQPSLGPDATALGQVFWYTLEGRDPKTGKPNGGWDPHELRSIQDFQVKYALNAAEGVSEVSSIGGFVKEYQVDINPAALKSYNVSVMDVMKAIKNSNQDIGAETLELNKVEYVIRGLGYIKSLEDLEETVITAMEGKPIRIRDVAHVAFGPATRRGGLDKGGAEAVGAVVVARYGSNPLAVINNVKDKIREVGIALPSRTLADGSESKVTIVPFYDRTSLIHETIGTLESALSHEILITIIVIIVLVVNLRASVLIASLLPIGVLMTFIAMKLFHIDANIVALSGIAIAIGVMVDIGIVIVENIVRHRELPENKDKKLITIVYEGTTEVSSVVITALSTTVISFLPVFTMEAAEGKLFRPLAFTKTFALLATFILSIIILPALSHWIFGIRSNSIRMKRIWSTILIVAGIVFSIYLHSLFPIALTLLGINKLFEDRWKQFGKSYYNSINVIVTLVFAVLFLAKEWLPLGTSNGTFISFLFVVVIIGAILGGMAIVIRFYTPILTWCLDNKKMFLSIPLIIFLLGVMIFLGFNRMFSFLPNAIQETKTWQSLDKTFPGIGQEFMPALDEGSFLLMPSSMPHTGIEQNIEYTRQLDMRVATIPEVEIAVGKWGRVNSAIDPAPIQMFENTINYKPEYKLNAKGHRERFKVNKDGHFMLKNESTFNPGEDQLADFDTNLLVPDPSGDHFRQWRKEIKNPNDIWNEIVNVTNIPGLTSSPKLQPIQTRLIMLATGMRAPMGLKVYGPDLQSIEEAGIQLESALKHVPSVKAAAVFYDRSVGAPYLEIDIDREKASRFGINIADVQAVLEVAVGGMALTTTVEGRERYSIRARYARELRDSPEDLKQILIPSMAGAQIPLGEIAVLKYERGPQMIRSENTFLVGYVLFDKQLNVAEVDVVKDAQQYLAQQIEDGLLILPKGVHYTFAGNYEQQERASKRLMIVIPISLALVFLLLYFQFKTITASAIHFSGVFVAFAGGFIMLFLYAQPWFMNFTVAGIEMRSLFHIETVNVSVAVWVGFIALFGVATDDGVIMGSYLHQIFEEKNPATVQAVREAVLEAGRKRVRPAMMTAATTIIALLPVLSSTGKGADIMIPMALPTFGGMTIQLMTIFVVPVLQSIWREKLITNELKTKSVEI